MNDRLSTEYITSTEEIFRVLKSLQINRNLLTLKTRGSKKTYSSMVLEVDLAEQYFVIDSPTPQSGNLLLSQGLPFTVVANYNGVQVMLKNNQAHANNQQEFENAFSVAFPESIYYQQRRENYRAPISQKIPTKLSLESNQREKELSGHILDLSPTGAGCVFSGYLRPPITNNESFDICRLTVVGQLELFCSAIAMHPRYDRVNDLTSCGVEFINLAQAQQKQLDRCVLDLQRTLKKDSGRYRYTRLPIESSM